MSKVIDWPWVADLKHPTTGFSVWCVDGERAETQVCAVTRYFSPDERAQIAHLVAAAPALRTQHHINIMDLELLRKGIEKGSPPSELILRVEDIIRRSEAVLVKAEGRDG